MRGDRLDTRIAQIVSPETRSFRITYRAEIQAARNVCALGQLEEIGVAVTRAGVRTVVLKGGAALPWLYEGARPRTLELVLPDGTITVFDNRTQVSKPRAVRFRINASKRTATFVQEVTDPQAPTSGSMGSARRLAGGDWVISWGGTKLVSEISGSGRIVWRLKFADSISYRVTPVPFGTIKATSLRRAMDRMFPRH